MPVCPRCKSRTQVELSEYPEKGAYFCRGCGTCGPTRGGWFTPPGNISPIVGLDALKKYVTDPGRLRLTLAASCLPGLVAIGTSPVGAATRALEYADELLKQHHENNSDNS